MAGSKLRVYEDKRDFTKTVEPRGNDGVRASGPLRFVVQRHAATRLHYDLRLEVDGVFKSWAVTKGPSLNPADKRLAVAVEDHPLAYGDFEGSIPKGEYGGGTVQLFDRGTWRPELDAPPDQSLADGELKFVLAGARLKGSFVLVRMKGDKFGGKRINWLLIKHRDADANDRPDGGGVLAITTSVASGRPMEEIAAGEGRSPKPFMLETAPAHDGSTGAAATPAAAAKTARAPAKRAAKAQVAGKSAAGASMPAFIEPQLCRQLATPPGGINWLHEIKLDGYRMQARVEAGVARLRTRTGLDWTGKFPAIAAAAGGLPDAMLDGEIVALDDAGVTSFPALQAAISAGETDALVFFAFDLLFHHGVDWREQPLVERKRALAALLDKGQAAGAPLRYVEHFAVDGATIFESARDLSLEGIVSKRGTATYVSGRSQSWVKAKIRAGEEVVIGAWTETDGRFRSLLGGVYRDGGLHYVGRIGTGYDAATLAALMPKLQAHAAEASPFTGKAPRDRSVHFLRPELVARVESAGWTGDCQLRQASFQGLREGKPANAAVTEAGAKPPHIAQAVRANVSGSRGGKVDILGVTLSHPDKALWPKAGVDHAVTKQGLAEYFAAVGDWMLPHIAGRPCSIVRAPDGIDHQTFFQRHAMKGGSHLLETVTVAGDHEPYLLIPQVAALVAIAQSGGVEIHPGNCLPHDPDEAGRLVFDLDPAPDVPFAEVVRTAKALRSRLQVLGLESLCKTTGGKGLHVVTPLAPSGVGWAATKDFAHDVCRAMETEAPQRYLTKMSKAARTGRIFLDYLRNDRLATAVAPLSPRARPHAPVSMPLTWAQVKGDLDPLRFTVASVPALLKRSKAWADYAGAARPLAPALARLAHG